MLDPMICGRSSEACVAELGNPSTLAPSFEGSRSSMVLDGVGRLCGCAFALPDLHRYYRIEPVYLTTDVMVGLTD